MESRIDCVAASSAIANACRDSDATGLWTNGYHFRRGRIAFHAILKSLGIGSGDEVIIQAFTCCVLPLPVMAAGAKPVFADIDLSTLNLDLSSVEASITPRTRAIVVQHTFGMPAEMDAILRLARNRGLYVIEDCCHTIASSYDGTFVGHLGDAAFAAYRWGKPLVLGIGGTAAIHAEGPRRRLAAIAGGCQIPGVLSTARTRFEYFLHQVALRPSTFWLLRDGYRRFIRMGVAIPTFPKVELEGSMSDLDQAMPMFHQRWLAERIGSAFEDIEFRRSRAARYAGVLREIGARTCKLSAKAEPAFLRFPFLAVEKAGILQEARRHKVELGDWFVSAVHPHSDSECQELGYRKGMCPAAERAGREVLTLPIYRGVTEDDVDRAVEFIGIVHRQGLL